MVPFSIIFVGEFCVTIYTQENALKVLRRGRKRDNNPEFLSRRRSFSQNSCVVTPPCKQINRKTAD